MRDRRAVPARGRPVGVRQFGIRSEEESMLKNSRTFTAGDREYTIEASTADGNNYDFRVTVADGTQVVA
jgi:hypothetical protein